MTTGALGQTGLDERETELLGGRLKMRAPSGAKMEARQHSIMAGPEAAEEESRVVLQVGDEQLVVIARELFALKGDDFAAAVRHQVERWHGNTEVKALEHAELSIIGVTPSELDTDDEAILVHAMFIGRSDETAQFLGFYVNPSAAEDPEGCRALTEKVAATIADGPGSALQWEAGGRDLAPVMGEPHLQLTVPDGYVVTVHPGPDFVVRRIRKLVPLGETTPNITIYYGRHPSPHLSHEPDAQETMEEVEAELFGTPIEWARWSIGDIVTQETIVGIGGDSEGPDLFLHISSTGTLVDLDELARVVATLAPA